MQTGVGGPSLCWMCNRQLMRARGQGLGLFYFHKVRDRRAAEYRVHGDCLTAALKGGNKLMKPESAHVGRPS